MKNNFIKKIIGTTLSLSLLTGLTAYAANVPLTAHKEIREKTSGYYYATGWIDTEPYHYSNTFLHDTTGKELATSGRKWGYGKVWAFTPEVGKYLNSNSLRASIYYGWK